MSQKPLLWQIASHLMTEIKPLGTAHPTCERCGQPLKIEILGEPDPDIPGDITQIHFKLPARHACRLPSGNRAQGIPADGNNFSRTR